MDIDWGLGWKWATWNLTIGMGFEPMCLKWYVLMSNEIKENDMD